MGALEAFAPNGRVLELACATGQWTATLARHASELTALDSAPEMLAIAARRVADDRVRFVFYATARRVRSAPRRAV